MAEEKEWGKHLLSPTSRSMLVDLLTKIGLGFLTTVAPWATTGVIGWVVNEVVNKILSKASDKFIIAINGVIVHLDVNNDVGNINESIDEIIWILYEHKEIETSEEDLEKLDKEMFDAYKHMYRSDRLTV